MSRKGNGQRVSSSAANHTRAEWAIDGAERAEGMEVEERIRRRAYELYLQRGERPGDALGDWLTAERECRAAPRDRTAAVTDHALAQLGAELRS